jgi:nucleotide-binding universal stress UspA family protein
MNRILVPVDFSAHDNTILQYAAALSKKEGAHIILLHVHNVSNKWAKNKSKRAVIAPSEAVKNEVLAKLDALRNKMIAADNLEVSTAVYTGPLTVCILQAAKDYDADLVLMAATEAHDSSAGRAGKETASILRASQIPVLIIPQEYEWSAPKKIIVAINSEKENLGMLKPVFDLSHVFGAALSIFIFSKEENEGRGIMADTQTIYNIRESLKVKYPNSSIGIVHLSGKDFTTTIKEYISKKKFDLLALITHHKSWIHNISGKSMTQEMAYASAIPLLSINPE